MDKTDINTGKILGIIRVSFLIILRNSKLKTAINGIAKLDRIRVASVRKNIHK